VVTDIILYVTIFILVILIYVSIIYYNTSVVYWLLALSLFLVLAAAAFNFVYAYKQYTIISNNITLVANNVNVVVAAVKSGLCCIAARECGGNCSGQCTCGNIPTTTYTVSAGTTPLAVVFTGPTPGFPLTVPYIINRWTFDFGDGTTSGALSTNVITHTYAKAGTYTTTLTINIDIPRYGFPPSPINLGNFTSLPVNVTVS
jgi:hypothetical protein